MIVFRLCKEDEVQQILDKQSFEKAGSLCQNSDKNSHAYNENVKYMHFFAKKSDLLYLNTLKGRFICEYNIPDTVLANHYGLGKYLDYINFSEMNKVEEFAIPSRDIRFDYLESINKITKDIDYEDMFEDSNLKGFVQEVYNSDLNYEKTN